MQQTIELLSALVSSLGFAGLFNLHGKKMIYAALGGLFAWAIYMLVEVFTDSPYICAFISSIALTLYSETMARVQKSPVTVFLVIAVIPLVPGAGLYRTMNYFMHQQPELAAAQSLYTLLFAASMSAGIALTTVFFQIVLRTMRRYRIYP